MTTTYQIATTGDDRGDGSLDRPWATFNHALSAASSVRPGDSIMVRGGTYNQHVRPTVSGREGAPITVRGYPGEQATIAGVQGREGLAAISGVRNLTFGAGLHFSYRHPAPDENYRFPWIFVSGAHTSHIKFERCSVERPGWEDLDILSQSPWREWGIMVDDAIDVTLDGLNIRGVNQGVQIKNKAYGCTVRACDIGFTRQSCIVLAHSGGEMRRVLLIGNLLHDSAIEDGIQCMQDFDAPDNSVDDSNRGTQIYGNRIFGCRENAIDLKGAAFVVIDGNSIWGIIGSNDGALQGGYNRNSMGAIIRGANTYSRQVIIRNNIVYDCPAATWLFDDYKAYHNVFVYNRHDFTGPGSRFNPGAASPLFVGIRQNGNTPGMGIVNNIFSGHKAHVALFASNPHPTNEADIGYNLYVSGSDWIDRSKNKSYTSLAAWRECLQQNNWRHRKEDGSIEVASHAAIGFVNVPPEPTQAPENYDFSLRKSSPARQAGGPLTVTAGAGTGTWLPVVSAGWFSDGQGRNDVSGDIIHVNGQSSRVVEVDYVNHRLRLNTPLSWGNREPVFYGPSAKPDIGVTHLGSGSEPGVEPPLRPDATRSITFTGPPESIELLRMFVQALGKLREE